MEIVKEKTVQDNVYYHGVAFFSNIGNGNSCCCCYLMASWIFYVILLVVSDRIFRVLNTCASFYMSKEMLFGLLYLPLQLFGSYLFIFGVHFVPKIQSRDLMAERENNNKNWFQTLMCTRFDSWCWQPGYGRAKNGRTLKIKSDEMIMYASNFYRGKSFPRRAAASKPNNLHRPFKGHKENG